MIENSLYLDLEKMGESHLLTFQCLRFMIGLLTFHMLEKDTFDAYYFQQKVNGELVGMPEILASTFTHIGTEFKAYRFDRVMAQIGLTQQEPL